MTNDLKKNLVDILEEMKNDGLCNFCISIKKENYIVYPSFKNNKKESIEEKIFVSDSDDIEAIEKNNPLIVSHTIIYEHIKNAKIVAQLDSQWCNIWSMLGEALPRISYIHSMFSKKDIPCTEDVKEFNQGFGSAIAETLRNVIEEKGINDLGYFIKHNGAIVWGYDIEEIREKTKVLERLSKEAYYVKTALLNQYKYMPYQLSDELYKLNKEK